MTDARRIGIGTAVLLLLALGGCAGSGRFVYVPRPAEVTTLGTGGAPVARTLVSVTGARYADEATGRPPGVEVRLRIEDLADAPITLDPASLGLVTADLTPFPPPILERSGPVTVPPAGAATIEAHFPFPPADPSRRLDATGLSVTWMLRMDDRAYPGSTTVRRPPPPTRSSISVGYQTGFWPYEYRHPRHSSRWYHR